MSRRLPRVTRPTVRTRSVRVLTSVALASCMAVRPATAQDAASLTALVDRALARAVTPQGPGCAVGVTVAGASVTRTRGLADLERAVPLTPASIIEAGSVSKQFTAAAVILLSLDGALGLDDDIRRWFPELPTYEAPLTVRHLLTHTSGLRDWGAIVALEGWPRGARAHTNAHVLQIVARQRALNYAPGATYSYTNSGYNLLAVLVERVSGQSLAAFTQARLFAPLGMTSTSWRDDHQRVVANRALAYTGGSAPRLSMPDESAYGNGGLLTTPADLLRWSEALRRRTFGAAFQAAMEQRMVVTNGDTLDYALGVNVLRHRGTRELSHSGSTGGYRAHLLHFPERDAGVAVLCNGAGLNATQLAEALGDSLVGARTRPTPRAPLGGVVHTMRLTDSTGAMVPAAEWSQLTGTFASDEVQGAPYTVTLEAGALVLRQAPDSRRVLVPAADGRFVIGGGIVRFERGADGRAIALHMLQDRAWDVRFVLISR
jgi:CubicO group peptidase (beta-lactamase class C family)